VISIARKRYLERHKNTWPYRGWGRRKKRIWLEVATTRAVIFAGLIFVSFALGWEDGSYKFGLGLFGLCFVLCVKDMIIGPPPPKEGRPIWADKHDAIERKYKNPDGSPKRL